MTLLEIIRGALFKDRRRKRAERFALLDAVVKNFFHVCTSGVDHDRAIAQRAWPKLHASLKPTYDQPVCDVLSRPFGDNVIRQSFKDQPACFQLAPNLIVTKLVS